MAYIRNTTQTDEATGSTYTVTLGSHATDDLLLICLTQDGGATAITQSGGSDWTFIGTQAASGGCRQAWAYKIATSGSEANPTFAGANDEWLGVCLVIRDAHATEPFGSTPTAGVDFVRTDWNAVGTTDSGALTTAVDECLLIYSWGSDGGTRYIRHRLSEAICDSKSLGSGCNYSVSHNQQLLAGAAPTVTAILNVATEGGNGWVLAVRNKSGGILQPRVVVDIEELYWYGPYQYPATPTWQAADNFTANINGISCSSVAPATTTTGSTADAWMQFTSIDMTDSTAGAWSGGTHAITSTDFTGALISLHWSTAGSAGSAVMGTEGYLVGFSDGTNWVTYQIATKAFKWATSTTYGILIDPATATPYASSGTIDWAAVTRVGYFNHRVGSAATATNSRVGSLSLLRGPTIIAGGDAARPLTWGDYHAAIISCGHTGLSISQGGTQFLVMPSVQIGDGSQATYYDGISSALVYPIAWSATKVPGWQMGWNVGVNGVGVSVKASAADTILFANGLAATTTKQGLSLDAASSTSATYSFSQPFVGFDVDWLTGVACDSVVFAECYKTDLMGASANRSVWTGSQATDAAALLSVDGASITNSTFTAGSESYAVEISIAGDYVLEGNTYTGYAKEIYVSATTGTVTITILSSDAVPDYDSDGATVVIDQPYTSLASITDLEAGSRVYIYNVTTATEIYNDIVAGTSYSQGYNDGTDYTDGDVVEVRIAWSSGATAKLPVSYSTVASATGWAVLAQQEDDAIYNANAIDGDTVTEFIADYPNVEIDLDDPDGTTTPQRGYAWYISGQMTEDGIRYYHGAMAAEDAFNYRVNVDVTDMHVQNINVNPVIIKGARLYRSDGSNVTVAGTGPIQMEPDKAYSPLSRALEGSLTGEDILRILLAGIAGKRSGLGTATELYMAQDGTTPRITFTPTDDQGNGTAVVDGS